MLPEHEWTAEGGKRYFSTCGDEIAVRVEGGLGDLLGEEHETTMAGVVAEIRRLAALARPRYPGAGELPEGSGTVVAWLAGWESVTAGKMAEAVGLVYRLDATWVCAESHLRIKPERVLAWWPAPTLPEAAP